MPVYLFWGEDDFTMSLAVAALRDRTLDPEWTSFNYEKLSAEQPEAVLQGLTLSMTPPFGAGNRLVWLAETAICQKCPEEVLAELERSLPVIPESTVLLLTMSNKPDGRIKSTKLLQKHATVQAFEVIPPWKTELLVQQVRQAAQTIGVKLTPGAVEQLAELVGNQSRQLHNELAKLSLFVESPNQTIDEVAVATLVTPSTQSSLKLATAIRQGQTDQALTMLMELFSHNEHPLRIVMTLVGQFRTWLWVKLMLDAGERDERKIAASAEVSNPKRIYFLRQEVQSLSLRSLQQTLPILLSLEYGLKQGVDPTILCQTKLIELCQLFEKH